MNSGSTETRSLQVRLVRSLKSQGIVRSRAVENALLAVRREEFLWPGIPREAAYTDEPIALGGTGQTISAPHMVAMMLEELELAPGLRVLEVGGGSGYNAALLGCIVKQSTNAEKLVFSVERDPTLAKFARENISRVGLSEVVEVVEGDGSLGHPPRLEKATYDRVIVAAGAPSVPHYLELQLKPDGILEIPIGNFGAQTLTKFRKKNVTASGKGETKMEREQIVDCMFVPLVGEDGYGF